MKKTFFILILLILGFCNESGAVPLDFRSSVFSSANGSPSFYYGPAGLTIYAMPVGAKLYQDTMDGFGVNSLNNSSTYEWDEIEGVEYLKLHFNAPRILNSLLITDLFYETSNNGSYSYKEEGQYSFDNASWVTFYADMSQTPSPDTNGELPISFSSSPVISDIYFRAQGWRYNKLEDHEFSVARVDVTHVPEPATILLIGSGFIVLAQVRKRLRR